MLAQDIGDIRENLRMGRYPNEAAVSQGIVRRLLATLGWPIYDPQVVYPEYTLEGRRVDFALCYPASEPRIFIEVKGVGKGTGAERQLFEYAFHQGIPLAILTDGREWSFFLPAGEGSYDKRRVCKLNLSASDIAEAVQRFERYLRYDAVRSGAARKAAQDDYQDVLRERHARHRERQIIEALPQAWAKLVKEKDKSLLNMIADCVEDLCGYRPIPDTIARFLQELVHQTGARSPHTPARTSTLSEPPPAPEEMEPTDVTLSQPPTPSAAVLANIEQTHVRLPVVHKRVETAGYSISSMVRAIGGDRAKLPPINEHWRPVYHSGVRWVPKTCLGRFAFDLTPSRKPGAEEARQQYVARVSV